MAANEAYRAGDLDQARQLTDQAAALDPSRAELWQQHRQQIDARQLILDAQAADADGDHQRAGTLLGQARQLDPRMPALWDGNLPAPRAAQHNRQAREHDAPLPGPRQPADKRQEAAQATGTTASPRSGSVRQADQMNPPPSWPSSPAVSQPQRSDPARQVDATQPPLPPSVQAAPRQPRARPEATAEAPDVSAEPADSGPARWPAPDPHKSPEARPSFQHARHEAETRNRAEAESSVGHVPGKSTPSADWRDQIIQDARTTWQPSPIQAYDPAVLRSPEHQAPEPGIEAGA